MGVTGDSLAKMADGTVRRASEIRVGDTVAATNDAYELPARVTGIVVTHLRTTSTNEFDGRCDTICLRWRDYCQHGEHRYTQHRVHTACLYGLPDNRSLTLSAWHPILTANDNHVVPQFPYEVPGAENRVHFYNEPPVLYDFMLEEAPFMLSGGTPVATLGAGLDGPVLGHPFFRDRAALEACLGEEFPSWRTERMVHLQDTRNVVRDRKTGLVSRLVAARA